MVIKCSTGDQRFIQSVRGGFGSGRGRGGASRGGKSLGESVGVAEEPGVVGSGFREPVQKFRKVNDLVCWTCDKKGHFARDCPEKAG